MIRPRLADLTVWCYAPRTKERDNMGSTIVAGFEIAAIAQIDAKYVRMSKLGGGQGNASFMAPAEARAVAYALLRSADEVDGGDRAVGAVTHGRPAEGPCSRASHTGVRCGNAARYVDAAGVSP